MPTVNQASLRDEFARLKGEFGALKDAGKVPAETAVLMNAVFMLLEMMVAVFPEKTTSKSSKNASLPPLQTDKDESATTPGSRPRGSGGQGQRLDNSRTIETTTIVEVHRCSCCAEDLSGVAAHDHERRTRIDIVFEKTIEHVDAQIKICPACNGSSKGEFASDLMGPMQYGIGVLFPTLYRPHLPILLRSMISAGPSLLS